MARKKRVSCSIFGTPDSSKILKFFRPRNFSTSFALQATGPKAYIFPNDNTVMSWEIDGRLAKIAGCKNVPY